MTDMLFLGIELKAYRLFGPQPRATTYLCLWECTIPRVSAFLSPALALTLRSSMAAVIYNFDDIDNAPASIYVQNEPPDGETNHLELDDEY